MPNRILREGILTSPKIAKLNWAEEVLYRRLMSVADDFGRYPADPGILLGHLYSRQLKKVSESDIGKWLDGVQAAGLVRVYPSQDGEHYLEIVNFGQQIRAQKSKYPAPPASASNCLQTQSDAPVFVFEDESVSEGVSPSPAAPPLPPPEEPAKPSKAKKAQKIAIPADFSVSDAVRSWAAEKGFDRLDQHLEGFKLKVAANSYVYANWDAAFMTAIREDWSKVRAAPMSGGGSYGSAASTTVAHNPQYEETQRRLAEEAKRTVTSPEEVSRLRREREAKRSQGLAA